MQPNDAVNVLRGAAQRLRGASDDYDSLLESIGDARLVLLGERLSHYFRADLREQFDAILAETRAVEPLEPTAGWHKGEEAPETFPSGI